MIHGTRSHSVNVSRLELLAALRKNREIHAKEYAEALEEYSERLLADLQLAVKKVKKETDLEKLKSFRFSIAAPVSHLDQYDEIIEMLDLSVDETVNLDSDAFKAYFKNQWDWTRQFMNTKMSYAMVGSSLSL